jgi:hypothetical protein
MKRGIIWVVLVLMAASAATLLGGPAAVTQGEFAVELSTRLALGQGFILEEKDAILTLDRIGIGPDGGWSRNRPVSPDFLRQIEASMRRLLEKVSRDMNLPDR